jgi:hypothetical protein
MHSAARLRQPPSASASTGQAPLYNGRSIISLKLPRPGDNPAGPLFLCNRDRGEPRGSSPPTPPDVLRSYPAVPSSFELPPAALETARARFAGRKSVVKARVQVASVRLRLLARGSSGYASAAPAWREGCSPLYAAPRGLIFLSLTPCTRWFSPSPPNGLWPTRRVLRPRLTSALPSHAVADMVVLADSQADLPR